MSPASAAAVLQIMLLLLLLSFHIVIYVLPAVMVFVTALYRLLSKQDLFNAKAFFFLGLILIKT